MMVIAIACQKENLQTEATSELSEFTAATEITPTKTSLDAELNVLWTKDDRIAIFDGNSTNVEYKVTNASAGKTSAELEVVSSSGYTAGTELNNNVGYYPYSSGTSIAKGSDGTYNLSVTLPATQNYATNSFGQGAFPMVAVTSSTSDKNLAFKNVCGALKLQLMGTDRIKQITFSGNNNEVISGAATVTAKNGAAPTVSLIGTNKTVTLDCGTSGVQLNEGSATSFIIALPPITFSNGFTVKATDINGKEMEISTTKSKTICRNEILKMAEKAFVGVPVSGIFTVRAGADGIAGTEDDVKVLFSKGNLYWDGSSFKTEISQYDFRQYNGGYNDYAVQNGISTTTPDNTVGTFYYSYSDTFAYQKQQPSSGTITNSSLFTNDMSYYPNSTFTVNGERETWRTLASNELEWLLGSQWKSANPGDNCRVTTTGGAGTTGTLCNNARFATIQIATSPSTSVNGLLIFPDSFLWTFEMGPVPASVNIYDGSFSTFNWSAGYTLDNFKAMENAGCVFLPAAGCRSCTNAIYSGEIYNANERCYYWASNCYDSMTPHCLKAGLTEGVSPTSSIYRTNDLAMSIRLVKNI